MSSTVEKSAAAANARSASPDEMYGAGGYHHRNESSGKSRGPGGYMVGGDGNGKYRALTPFDHGRSSSREGLVQGAAPAGHSLAREPTVPDVAGGDGGFGTSYGGYGGYTRY